MEVVNYESTPGTYMHVYTVAGVMILAQLVLLLTLYAPSAAGGDELWEAKPV